jgi:hypothetical protein
MTPEQFAELQTLLTQMLTPVRDLALYQLTQLKQPLPPPPTTRSILSEQQGRSDAEKRTPMSHGGKNPGPFTVNRTASPSDDPNNPTGWQVTGATSIGTGFIGTWAACDAEAARLNTEPAPAEPVPVAQVDPAPVASTEPLTEY